MQQPIPPLAIESIGLAKRFGDRVAVSGIDLAVPAGAIYGFLGANGAGKTTTIRMLLGLMRPSGGTARIFGCDVRRDRMSAARQVGALLDARATYDHLTGRANLDITRRLLGLPAGEIDRVLAIVDLRAAAGRKAGHYSLGMRQRLGLARALLGSPRLLILDEPMNGLDPDGIADMRRTIRTLPDAMGVTVFLSSHLLVEVEQVATHIGLMASGRLVAQGTLTELLGLHAPALQLRTSDDRRAALLLAEAGFPVNAEEAGLTLPWQGGEAETATIARLLIGAGLDLRALTPRPADLEALYLSWSERKAA
jgi:ABC-type multidrug transport system ATPase subunit